MQIVNATPSLWGAISRSSKYPDTSLSLSNLLNIIYAASSDAARWQEVIAAIAYSMRTPQCALFTPHVEPRDGGFFYALGLEKKEIHLQDASLRTSLNGLDERAERRWHGIVPAASPGLPSSMLALYRGPNEAPFSDTELELIKLMMPHLSTSLGLMHRLHAANQKVASMHAALDRMTSGVLLLSRDLEVVYTNQPGQDFLSRQGGLGLNLRRKLVTGCAIDSRYSVQCFSLDVTDPLLRQGGACHIVFATDAKATQLPDLINLGTSLGLTPAEAKVSRALVQYGNYTDIANLFGVSIQTVRSQVKAIYAKTQVNNKASLTRLILSLSTSGV